MKRRAHRAAALLPLVLLGGCLPVQYGVHSSNDSMPVGPAFDTGCVTAAIGRVPGVTGVTHDASVYGGGTGIVPHFGRKLTTHNMLWRYRIGDRPASLQIVYQSWGKAGKHGTARYSNRYSQIEPLPEAARAELRPVIGAIDRAIAEDCRVEVPDRVYG